MKQLKHILLLAGIISLASCSFLDMKPQDFLAPSQYYKTEADLETALTGVYSTLHDGALYKNYMLGRLGLDADLGYDNRDGDVGTSSQYLTAASDVKVEGFWQSLYKGINNANRLLAEVDNPDIDIAQTRRDEIKGEALFLRSYYYFLLVSSFGDEFMEEGDEVILSVMEHHSNIVPWQLLAARKGIAIKVIPMNDKGELLLDEYEKLFSERTKIVSVVQVSNVLGTVNPVKEMIATAHAHGVPFLVDAAQSIPHMKVDVQDLGADFLVFSAHKIYGPTGVGVLYGKEEWLDRLPPYQGGGEMIQHVSFEKTTFNELPFKFEAGTPDYIGTTGLAKALDYVNGIGMERIADHEHELTNYALRRLKEIPDMRIFGEASDRGAVISFLVGNIHHFDLGTLLDRLGIAVRTGHHCAQPLMQRLGIEGTVRASFAMYNTKAEVDALVAGIERVSRMF